MAYREVAVFEVREVLRLWLACLAFRRIAEMVRCDRKTVTKIVRIAEGHGLVQTDSPDRLTDDFVGGVMAELAPKVPDRHGEAWNVLVGHREKLEGWRNDDVPAKKMVELLKRDGVVVPERTLNRYLGAEFGTPARSTVPVVDGEPGVELQVDFGELGKMLDEETGKRRRVWALVFTAGVSRHTFVWLSFNQNLGTVIDGCEAAWEFFGGVFRVLVPDNMATVVTKADALDPVLNVAFVEGQVPRSGVGDPREGWSSLQPQADSCCSAQALFVVGRMDRVKHLSKLFV